MATPDTLSWYTKQAQAAYAPVRAQTQTDLTNRFANQGILSSTGAVGETQKQLGLVDQQARNYANQQWQWDVARRDTQKQQGITNAMNLYNLLQSGAIGQAAYKKTVKWPTTYANTLYGMSKGWGNTPTAAFGPVGDPKPDATWGTNMEMYSRQNANNQAQSELQAQSDAAALVRQQDAQAYATANKAPAADPWDTLAATITAKPTWMSNLDLATVLKTSGIDLEAAAANPADPHHEQALAALQVMGLGVAPAGPHATPVLSDLSGAGTAAAPTVATPNYTPRTFGEHLSAIQGGATPSPGWAPQDYFNFYGNPAADIGAGATTLWDWFTKRR